MILPDGEEEQGEEDLTEWDDDGKGERDEREIISSRSGSLFVLFVLFVLFRICLHLFSCSSCVSWHPFQQMYTSPSTTLHLFSLMSF